MICRRKEKKFVIQNYLSLVMFSIKAKTNYFHRWKQSFQSHKYNLLNKLHTHARNILPFTSLRDKPKLTSSN